MYGRPCYVPGWSIKENGENIWEDKENGGKETEPKHLIYSYDIKKETPREFFKIGNAPLIPIGSTVKCKKNDPRKNSNSAYRLINPNKINWYPNPTIAASWDTGWDKNIKMIEDCEGYTRGPDMENKLLTSIPHQIASGADGWCAADTKTIHQDVPGCGRICSSWEYVGRKDKDSWGLWGDNQNGIDCPAAKLDQVWKLTDGSTSGRLNRELAVGAFSG
jgi:hypothetical protein